MHLFIEEISKNWNSFVHACQVDHKCGKGQHGKVTPKVPNSGELQSIELVAGETHIDGCRTRIATLVKATGLYQQNQESSGDTGKGSRELEKTRFRSGTVH